MASSDKTVRILDELRQAFAQYRQAVGKLEEVFDGRGILDYGQYGGELTLEIHLRRLLASVEQSRETIRELLAQPTGMEEEIRKFLERVPIV